MTTVGKYHFRVYKIFAMAKFKVKIDIFFEMEMQRGDKNGLYSEFVRLQ